MFLGNVFLRSPNEEPVSDLDALSSDESTDAPSSAPEQTQDTSDGKAQKAVPYERFKQVNDRYADAKAQLELLKKDLPPEPSAQNQPAVDSAAMKEMLKSVVQELGLGDIAAEAKQLRTERARDALLSTLRQDPSFNETRDKPRIVKLMEESRAQGEQIGALTAWKLLKANGPPKQAPVAHDAIGTTTGADRAMNPQTGMQNMSPNQVRELQAKESFKKMLNTDPAFRKALELD
jgi:hypothetical protein